MPKKVNSKKNKQDKSLLGKNYNQAIEVIDGRYTMCHWKKQACIAELKKDIRERGFIYPPPASVVPTVNVGGIVV